MFSILRRQPKIKSGRHMSRCVPSLRKHNWVCMEPESQWHRLQCADCGFTDSEITLHVNQPTQKKELAGAR